MELSQVDPDEWGGVWYDAYCGDYLTIEFAEDEIRLLDLDEGNPYHTCDDEEAFLNDAEDFHRLDPQVVANPAVGVENALDAYTESLSDSVGTFDEGIHLQYARDATTTVDLDEVKATVLAHLDAAFASVPPDGRLTKQRAKEAVEDAFDEIE